MHVARKRSYVILGSRESHDLVRDVRYVKDPRVSAEISAALLHATCSDFPDLILGDTV